MAGRFTDETVQSERDRFDEWLMSEPEVAVVIPREQVELRRALRMEA